MSKLTTRCVGISIGFVFISLVAICQSENLVKNFSFETYEACPDNYVIQDKSHRYIPEWSYPTYATPDYFNRCAPKRDLGVSVPKNFAGVSEPHSGDAYAGLILSGTDDGYREYVQGSLSKPLVKGQKYCITYYYKLASFSKFSVDQLSLYLTNEKIENSLLTNIAVTPQLNSEVGLFLDNIDEWGEFCTVYTAQGGERFFTIGNFKSYEQTNYVATDKDMKNLRNKEYAYYFIDDVIIRSLDNCTDCGCVPHDFEARIVDTSFSSTLALNKQNQIKNENVGHIKIGMAGGTMPYKVLWQNGKTGAELSGLPFGTYQYTAYDEYNCTQKGTIVFAKPVEQKFEAELGLEAIKEGESIILENIFFEFNKTTLLPQSFPELDKVVSFIVDNNISLIEISGHTDNDGSEAYNKKLSEGRAKEVVKYLQTKGVAATKLKAVGYGKSKPIETNFTTEGKARNRRVEFTLLKK